MALFLDIETEPVSHDRWAPRFVIAGYAYDDGPVEFTQDLLQSRRLLLEADSVVMHRGAFECGVLDVQRDWFDTALAATISGAARGTLTPLGTAYNLWLSGLATQLTVARAQHSCPSGMECQLHQPRKST